MKRISDIMTVALELNRKDFTVFVNFSGHVNKIRVDYRAGGWREGCSCTDSRELYTDGKISSKKIDGIIAWLVAASDNNEEETKKARNKANEKILADYETLKKQVKRIKSKTKQQS